MKCMKSHQNGTWWKLEKEFARMLKEYYDEYKKLYDNKKGTENPYSTINISSLLGISNKYYQRLENMNDQYKNISSDNLYKLADIFEISIDEFYK